MQTKIPHLYVHIPFCHEKCAYCDFATVTLNPQDAASPTPDYLQALLRELNAATQFFGSQTFESIYFGGGTPSVWPVDQLESFLSALRAQHSLAANPEISIECNPNSFDEAKLKAYLGLGINRISLGVQTFCEPAFKTLGRSHSVEQSRAALWLLKNRWPGTWSIDLMQGLPHQTLLDATRDLAEGISYQPPHLSLYGLLLEGPTPFRKQYVARQAPLPNEDCEADMYTLAINTLSHFGYEHYELSNFCQLGHASRHNLAYWQDSPYLGLGLSAASFVQGQRFSNNAKLKNYLSNPVPDYPRLMNRLVPVDKRLSEKLFLMLRTSDGLTLSRLNAAESNEFLKHRAKKLDHWIQSGHVDFDPNAQRWKLTLTGKLLANSVMAELV